MITPIDFVEREYEDLKRDTIPSAVIRRMPRYYRHLELLRKKGVERVSSQKLAMRTGLTASQIRQDLACFGEFGQQGYGYSVEGLMSEIATILGMKKGYTAVMVGAGRLGRALAANFPFARYGIHVTALYDIDPEIVGSTVCGLPVYHADSLAADLVDHPVDIGILTASVSAANELADILAESVKGIWNFTNAELKPRIGKPVIEDIHFFDSLFSLCCTIAVEPEVPEDGRKQA